MNHEEVFKSILDQINWTKGIIQRKGWDIQKDLLIERPATPGEVSRVEEQLGFALPADYKLLFLNCAKRIEFAYHFEDEPPEEFNGIFSGELYWDLDRLVEMHQHYQNWVEASLDPDYNDEEAIAITKRVWQNKVPLMEVANGDIIVVGNDPSEVVYFSHEGDSMHGKKLGNTLFEFMEFHSRIGFIGIEDWQFEPFYNYEKDKMEMTGPKVERFIEWFRR